MFGIRMKKIVSKSKEWKLINKILETIYIDKS